MNGRLKTNALAARRPQRIALIHLVPEFGDLAYNRDALERGVRRAAAEGADWIVTPEMWLSGWSYPQCAGTNWIVEYPDPWLTRLASMLGEFGMSGFISYPERDPATGLLYNSVVVIDDAGELRGTYRKRNLIPGAEAWATPGSDHPVFDCGGKRVGVIVCADAAIPEIGRCLQAAGADIIVAPSSWSPGDWGPNGEWEAMSLATGLPLLVCNRGGTEPGLDFSGSETLVVVEGLRVRSCGPAKSTVVIVDWDPVFDLPTSLFRELPL